MNPILKWLEASHQNLPITIFENSWTNYLWPDLVDVTVQFKLDEFNIIYGRGSSLDPDLALTKATAEFIERFALKKSSLINSNGLAVGSTWTQAVENATYELIERDLLLNHIACNEPLHKVSENEFTFSNQIQKFLSDTGITISCFEGRSSNFGQLMVTRADGRLASKNFGFVFGFGLKPTRQESITSSLNECIRDLMYFLNQTSHPSISPDEFSKKTSWDFMDHIWLNLNNSFAESIDSLFSEEPSKNTVPVIYDKKDISIERITLGLTEISASHLHVAHASSANTNALKAGVLTVDDLNKESVHRFGGELNPKFINQPHFIS